MKIIKKMMVVLLMGTFFLCVGCGEKKTDGLNSSNEFNINAWQRVGDQVCRADDGYYIFCEDFLYTTDGTDTVPLCNKADCNHKNKDCNAYLSGAQEQTVWYDGKHIYAVGKKGGNTYSVYEINKDGSGSKKLCNLFQASGYGGTGIMCSYKDGYIYYRMSLQDIEDIKIGRITNKIYRTRLESGAEPELIYENQEDEKTMTVTGAMYFYGDDMYVTISTYSMDSGNMNTAQLYRYSTKENKLELFLDRYVGNFFIEADVLYYTSSDGIHKYSLNGETDEMFCKNPMFSEELYFDGEYIYATDFGYLYQQEKHSDKKNIYVLNLDGNELKVIAVDWNYWILFGDGKNIVMQNDNPVNTEEGSWIMHQYYFYDKGQISTEKSEWTCVEIKGNSNVEE